MEDSFNIVQWYYINDPCFEERKLREFYLCECSHEDLEKFFCLIKALGFPMHKIFMYEYSSCSRPANDRVQEVCKLFNFADNCHFN